MTAHTAHGTRYRPGPSLTKHGCGPSPEPALVAVASAAPTCRGPARCRAASTPVSQQQQPLRGGVPALTSNGPGSATASGDRPLLQPRGRPVPSPRCCGKCGAAKVIKFHFPECLGYVCKRERESCVSILLFANACRQPGLRSVCERKLTSRFLVLKLITDLANLLINYADTYGMHQYMK
jgi:hypothetical protein